MPDVLENLSKLPVRCAAVVNEEAVIIERGVMGYTTAPFGVDSVTEYNQQRGITPAQRQAMEIGSTIGWEVEGADSNHWVTSETLEGEETFPKFFTYVAPFSLQICVTALSEPLAAQIAETKREQFLSRALNLLSVLGVEIQDVMTDGELDLVEAVELRE